MNTTRNAFVTGGTGFVGTWMRKTRPDGVSLAGVGRDKYDVINRVTQMDYIVHLAPVDPIDAIEAARDNNCRLLYCSSGIVYHPENDTQYRRDKMQWEFDCLTSGVDVVIARLFTFMQSSTVYNALFDAARAGNQLRVWGDCTRSFMHGRRMGEQMWDILRHGENGCAYDVGSDRAITVMQLAQRIHAFTGCVIKQVKNHPVPMPVYLPTENRI